MSDLRRIAVLGSTGSIGLQVLEVIESFPDRFRVVALSCRCSLATIIPQARRHRPLLVAITDAQAGAEAASALRGLPVEIATGPGAAERCAALPEADVVVAAASGIAGLRPVWAAVEAGKAVALANKEPLVAAGHLITQEAARSGARLIPVDSEHSAIFQLLLGQDRKAVRRVVLTASGGAFRDLPPEALEGVTPEQALAHPTWRMGPKVTVDSATLMNKGLEIIEARWLFGLSPEQIEVVVHPDSIVHSLVEFADGSLLAQLAHPDMRLPIQFALSHPERLPRPGPGVDLAGLGELRFSPFSPERWPCVKLAREALAQGGTAPAALNAADEVAVAWFLEGKIRFTQIPEIIAETLRSHRAGPAERLEQVLQADQETRAWLHRDGVKWIRRQR
jgi:1-deoxy-D-xylulose-5-phosphate reductoisomerase